jgi:16S rRNA (uracil1498-N3)-methyltransferase
MVRRVHVKALQTGTLALDPASARHVVNVLRQQAGDVIELFDNAGRTAFGTIASVGPDQTLVTVEQVRDAVAAVPLTVAAAIPKGDRADWMVEKLSELGVDRFVPLVTARSVVVPAGRNKFDRWERIAIESAKQSRRPGVMRIEPVTPVADVLRSSTGAFVLSTGLACPSIGSVDLQTISTLLIGPEGGWDDLELTAFQEAGITAVALTTTVLRVETAAIVAAGVVMCGRASRA